MDYEKIYGALETIKETCEKMQNVGSCSKCPMGTDNGTCLVTNLHPFQWTVTPPQKIVRAME